MRKEQEQIRRLNKLWETNHLLTCLAEECGEVMELLYLTPDDHQEIEHELNDILAVAQVLYDKGILEKCVSDVAERCNQKDIFECIKDIQYFSHKAIRFGLLDAKPMSLLNNKDQISRLSSGLGSLVDQSIVYSLWDNHGAKIDKVLSHIEYAQKNHLT